VGELDELDLLDELDWGDRKWYPGRFVPPLQFV
jgi:hypothetical protein